MACCCSFTLLLIQRPSIPLLRVEQAWSQVTCPNVVVDTRYIPREAFLAVGREEWVRLAHRLSASASQSCIVRAGSPHASCKRCDVGVCQPARSGWLRSAQSRCLIGVFFLGHRVNFILIDRFFKRIYSLLDKLEIYHYYMQYICDVYN